MARAQGARSQLALAFETVYGTAPVGGYRKMPFASSTLGSQQPLLNSELLGYGRDPLPPVKDAITCDGDVVVPIDLRNWGVWLKAAFGDPVTTEDTGVYTHEFQSGEWDLPSFSAEVGMPDVPYFGMVSGCNCNTLSWQMQRSGLVTATAGIIAQGEETDTVTGAGSPAAFDVKRFGSFNGAITREGTPLGNIVSAQINYTNNLDRIETIRNDGKIDGADPSIAALTGTMEVRFASQTLLDQAINGTPAELTFGYVIGANEQFVLTAHAVYLPKPRLPIQGPQGVQASFEWQAALDSGEGVMCTAQLINDVADYDNPV
ncbi:MAG: hypothetical protein Kow0032_07320 [Methyloligellaceae bacterium]